MLAEMIADAAEYGLVATTIVPGSDQFGGWAAFPHFIWQQPIMRDVISDHPQWFPTLARTLCVDQFSVAGAERPGDTDAFGLDHVGGDLDDAGTAVGRSR